MVGRAVVANFGDRRRRRVLRIGRGSVILEPGVVRDVIFSSPGETSRASVAARGSIGIHARKVEPAHERSPGNSGGGQQIAYVLAAHLHLAAGGIGAHVADWVRVANHSERTRAASHLITVPFRVEA